MKTLFSAIGLLTLTILYGCFSSPKINTLKSPLHYQSKFDFFELPDDEKIIETDYVSFITKKEDGGYVQRKFYGNVLVSEIEYANKALKIKNGINKIYHINGKLKIDINYVNDRIEGELVNYYDTGKQKSSTQYINGEKNGKAYGYDESGTMNASYIFKNDKEIEPRVYYYEDGAKKMTLDIDSPALEKYGYQLNYAAYYSGKFELFDSIGNKVCDGKYEEGELVNSNCSKEVLLSEKIIFPVEEMPQFPGGDTEMFKFLFGKINYPVVAKNNDVQGLVVLNFNVLKDGSITDIKILRGIDPSIAEEAVRVLKLMPKWIPGKVDGKPVKVSYKLPVRFKLE